MTTAMPGPGPLVPISVDQYHQMIEHGIVPEDATVELLRGVLARKDRSSPGQDPRGHSPLHRVVVAALTALAGRVNRASCHLQIQLPLSVPPDSEPEPDAAIVRGAVRDYTTRIPGGADVTCVIEVAHSSIRRDRQLKYSIYASANIPQYVLINLDNNTIEVYTHPEPATEQYRTKNTLDQSDEVSLQLPGGDIFTFSAAEILPR